MLNTSGGIATQFAVASCVALVAACSDRPIPPMPLHIHYLSSSVVFFAPGSIGPTDETMKALKGSFSSPPAKAALEPDNRGKTFVQGHADNTGSEAANQHLSLRRAEWIAKYLSEPGVQNDRLVVQGFGSSRLVVLTLPNTPEPQNRRVEIFWVNC